MIDARQLPAVLSQDTRELDGPCSEAAALLAEALFVQRVRRCR